MYYKIHVANIKLIIFDVDGVLTDGKIVIGTNGELFKSFHCQDGLGIKLLQAAGIKTAIITGRKSEIVAKRGLELKIGDVYQGVQNKLTALFDLEKKYGLSSDEIAYIGDDLIDLPVMCRIGLACAVANAAPEVKGMAKYVAQANGGDGAVREVAEMILKAQGKWDALVETYLTIHPLTDTAQ